jgi:glycerol uptake facilitator-like aquaporin
MLFNRSKIASLGAEFFGTAILVMVAIVLTETTAVSYFVGTSVALTLAVVYMLFGSISGGHFNPAITFGMWTARRIASLRAVSYIAAQMLGGLAAWQLYQYFTDKPLIARTVTYSTPMWLAEAVGTFVLAVGLTAAITRRFDALQSALTYGASLFVAVMIAATASAGFVNPAVALGVRSWGTVYVLGPLVGALVGVNLYSWLLSASSSKK